MFYTTEKKVITEIVRVYIKMILHYSEMNT